MWHVWGRGEVHTEFWWGDLRVRGTFPRPRRRWEVNIKTDLQVVGWEHRLDLSGSGQGQVAGSCKRGNEPSVSIKCEEILE